MPRGRSITSFQREDLDYPMPEDIADEPVEGNNRNIPWRNAKQKEKIDRLRFIVKDLKRQLKEMDRSMRLILNHSHDQAGRLVVDVDNARFLPWEEQRAIREQEDRDTFF